MRPYSRIFGLPQGRALRWSLAPMLRPLLLWVALFLSAASATSSSHGDDDRGNSEIGGKDLVGWRIELDAGTRVVHALGVGAQKAGCLVERPSPDRVLARCAQGVLALVQDGRTLLVGCDKITRDQCRLVFDDVLAHTPLAAPAPR